MRKLAPRIWLVAQLIDGLELSCTVAQTGRYGSMPVDELEAALARLGANRPVPRASAPTPWWVQLDGDVVPVYLLPRSPRPGWRYALESPAWLVLVSSDGAARPRVCIQLRSERLLIDGPLVAWRQARDWVTANLVPLIGRRLDDEPVWRISRLDLAADVAGAVFTPADSAWLTTRARDRARRELPATTRERGRVLSGFEVGRRGSAAYARLYLKSLQAAADAPVRELWAQHGYEPAKHGASVWRIEFEVRPALLRQLRAEGQPLPADVDSLIADNIDAVWAYLTRSWLTFRDRTRARSRVERTPVAPWWGALSELRGLNGALASRATVPSRVRSRRGDRDRLLKLALGALAGVAALDGTADLASTLATLADFAEEQGGNTSFAGRTDAARARYGMPMVAASRPRTLLPDALPVLADAA